ncbi:hypothetical protein K493DRAFT_391023 [Basidiobolus meristosporus CBS 931.73]|uniref:Uncharacterized protein n=1 Tax=Basidiobolus meristosporus CBS 931.73 TaxID=1314790 RepID=A0A1Y1YRR3_9FUNG|nr:hypothetical protein K493DRAFT_391023 [Basidiobolus meristosporus CBS 931.73]|eukprot:ORY00722.1 hypothetical protein K493DRAFT_391023 [Basidiobolus meristosporus CBS 931.73]
MLYSCILSVATLAFGATSVAATFASTANVALGYKCSPNAPELMTFGPACSFYQAVDLNVCSDSRCYEIPYVTDGLTNLQFVTNVFSENVQLSYDTKIDYDKLTSLQLQMGDDKMPLMCNPAECTEQAFSLMCKYECAGVHDNDKALEHFANLKIGIETTYGVNTY